MEAGAGRGKGAGREVNNDGAEGNASVVGLGGRLPRRWRKLGLRDEGERCYKNSFLRVTE
jgi:hypothetical protein